VHSGALPPECTSTRLFCGELWIRFNSQEGKLGKVHMDTNEATGKPGLTPLSFYDQPGVIIETLPVGGVPMGLKQVANPSLGIGGAYGSWGESYDNITLFDRIAEKLGEPLKDEERMDLGQLGFFHRHHIARLTDEEYVQVETEVGARLLRNAAQACGWEPGEVQGVLIGTSGPVSPDYTERVARLAGIPESALKVSVHKACDGSVGALHLALNPALELPGSVSHNVAEELRGKKVLVGGIEGLSRFIDASNDINALQFFGNGAGVIGVVPGESMEFLVGKTHEAYDEEGVLAVHMYYPHSRQRHEDGSNIETYSDGENHIRLAGLMHEPEDGKPIAMAGMMGMVKLFVRNGVGVVREVYHVYQELMAARGKPDHGIAVAIIHHANLKINMLKEKHLNNAGLTMPMPWLLTEFGNVSAASNMIAFLKHLPHMRPGDHILIDGFGAGTYYDSVVVALPG
jgi:3-oxoacyl-[acyl-carrier-protein] synthase III